MSQIPHFLAQDTSSEWCV